MRAQSEVDSGVLGSDAGVTTSFEVFSSDPSLRPVVRGRKAVHPGVKVYVGTAVVAVDDGLSATSFWDVNGEAVKLGAGATEAEYAQCLAQRAAEVGDESGSASDELRLSA